MASTDPRFARLHSDPRFKRAPKRERKVKVDRRFATMFTDERFAVGGADKYGRGAKKAQAGGLDRLYELDEEDPAAGSADVGQVSAEARRPAAKASKKKAGKAAAAAAAEAAAAAAAAATSGEEGEEDGNLSDMTEEATSDEEAGGEEEQAALVEYLEQAEAVPRVSDGTRRLAVCNLNWDQVRAVDLLAVLKSFEPAGGAIRSVSVYLSDFGAERQARDSSEDTA